MILFDHIVRNKNPIPLRKRGSLFKNSRRPLSEIDDEHIYFIVRYMILTELTDIANGRDHEQPWTKFSDHLVKSGYTPRKFHRLACVIFSTSKIRCIIETLTMMFPWKPHSFITDVLLPHSIVLIIMATQKAKSMRDAIDLIRSRVEIMGSPISMKTK